MSNLDQEESNKNFPILGVGPKILITLCPFLVLFGILNSIYNQFFQIPINYYWMVALGIIFIIVGVFLFIYSERMIKNAYNSSEFITTKVYGYVRHPMYMSWGLSILPGIFCFFNSWLLFLILPFYYLIVRIYIKKEEKFMLNKYGEEYAYYKKKVNAFFPKLKKYKPK
ncbi:MAG: methyltransferase family protein [Promethearchaeota archaeon]|jgi:protein-S-isoprenylcysteine O-methyltransferase Ste14